MLLADSDAGRRSHDGTGWLKDRCAECGTAEDLHTHDAEQHPPLCPPCAALWYGLREDEDE